MQPSFRETPTPADIPAIHRITAATHFFRPEEVAIAVELIEERLAKGLPSGYYYWFADVANSPVGYVCHGPTPGAIGSFDLYWIVVDKENQGSGLGRELMRLAERSAAEMGCKRMYVETSGKELYAPTRRFYESAGYFQAARLPDFYDDGDDKIIYQKNLTLAKPEERQT